jgi:hypothetical protein
MDTSMDISMYTAEILWVDIFVYDIQISVHIDSRYKLIYMDKTDNYMDMKVISTLIYSKDIFCISRIDISLEYTWICKVENGYVWIP